MRHMGAAVILAVLLLACLTLELPAPERAAAPPSPHSGALPGELIDRLPASTLMAVEVRDLESRWAEITSIPAIPGFLDEVLEAAGLEAADLPRLAGDRAVVALVPTLDWRSATPVVLLDPPDPEEASAILERAVIPVGGGIEPSVLKNRGVIWVSLPAASGHLALLAAGDGTSARGHLMMDAVQRHLPRGGLVRGWANTGALRTFLDHRVEGTQPPLVELVLSFAAAKLDAMRFAGFRRDLDGRGAVVTDAVIGLDPDGLPPEVLPALRPAYGPEPYLPEALPRGTVLASAFRMDPSACRAWVHHVAARDPRGPLRNLDFWTQEVRSRWGVSLDDDFLGALGERGWLLLLEGGDRRGLHAALLMETREPGRLEESLMALRSLLAEHVAIRSLGGILPRELERSERGRTIHGLALWTPLGEMRGPSFVVTGSHALVATSDGALESGLAFLGEVGESVRQPMAEPFADARPAGALLEEVRIDGTALARVIDQAAEGIVPRELRPLAGAAASLFRDAGEIAVVAWPSDDAIRIRGKVSFDPT